MNVRLLYILFYSIGGACLKRLTPWFSELTFFFDLITGTLGPPKYLRKTLPKSLSIVMIFLGGGDSGCKLLTLTVGVSEGFSDGVDSSLKSSVLHLPPTERILQLSFYFYD